MGRMEQRAYSSLRAMLWNTGDWESVGDADLEVAVVVESQHLQTA
jgi:hypothetical protein